jgi:phosphatidylethanolamine-binding protein (PEBP) family uncharacterized protein
VPADAVELALICHDPDAPLPNGFTHWTLYGIPPGTSQLGPDSDNAFRPGPNEWANRVFGSAATTGPRQASLLLLALCVEQAVDGAPTREEFLTRYAQSIVEQNRIVGTYET